MVELKEQEIKPKMASLKEHEQLAGDKALSVSSSRDKRSDHSFEVLDSKSQTRSGRGLQVLGK